MNARTCGVGSLKINFATDDIFHAKLGMLEVQKPISRLCDGDALTITDSRLCQRHIQGSKILLGDVVGGSRASACTDRY
jgi:hypothetical protein